MGVYDPVVDMLIGQTEARKQAYEAAHSRRFREVILDDARQTITKDRQDQYGSAEDSFAAIAELWSTYLKGRPADLPLNNFDVAMMMTLLKVARAKSNPQHVDNLVDICGYAALAGEMT